MSAHDFTSVARSLALPIDNDSDDDPLPSSNHYNVPRRSTEQSWRRRSVTSTGGGGDMRPRTIRDRYMQTAEGFYRQYMKTWRSLTILQQTALAILGVVVLVLAILFLVYNESIFASLAPAAEKWRKMPAGWLILWVMTFVVAFPPLIGYSTCITIAGFVFGMKGWFIVATATVLGSTTSFVVSRGLLRGFVSRLTEKNKRFAALSLVLKHDGLKLLIMIRLCPLPFSLSNGAISTIPTVSAPNFALATAIASPKLLLHIFVGSRLGDLAKNGDKMDAKTKMVSYLSIAFGVVAGIATGYVVYVRTKARAKQLEAEEALAAVNGGPNAGGDATARGAGTFADDPAEQAAVDFLRRGEDDISLHATYEDDLEAGDGGGRGGRGGAYRDEFTDDEDAQERDVFDVGDGDEEDNDDEDEADAVKGPDRR